MNYNEIMVTQAKSRVLRDLGVDIEPAKLILDEPLGADASGDFGGATIYINQNEKPGKIEEGKVYTVTTDSGSFTSVCKATTLEDNTALLFIGNGKLFALEDTGESFVISLLADEFSTMLYAVDYDNGSHMKIVSEETIHPIDPKFLPGVCLPVVEITSAEYPTDGIVELSAEEITQIDNALCLSSLIIFKFKGVFNDLSIMLPVIMSATPFDVEGITAYAMTNESKDKVL